MLLAPPRVEKLQSIALFVLAVTVVCIVVSISLIPVPEVIGTTNLIRFLRSGLLVCPNTLSLTLYRLDGLTSTTGLLGLVK